MLKKMSKKNYCWFHFYEKEYQKFPTTNWNNNKSFAKNPSKNFLESVKFCENLFEWLKIMHKWDNKKKPLVLDRNAKKRK